MHRNASSPNPISLSFAIVGCLVLPVAAHADPCSQLSTKQRGLAEKLFLHTYPYDCCDEPLQRCLKQKPVCRLARRLQLEICHRVAAGQDEARVKSAMERRARSMMPSKRAGIDLAGVEPAGDAKAKVVVTVYACARCPFCAKVVPELHRIATGPLKGKMVLYMKPFPISGHAGAKEGGLALQAATRLKRFWPFALKLYAEFNRFQVTRLTDWATQVGLARDAFQKEMSSPDTQKRLVESKREGIRNRVEMTPTLFIDGRKYVGELGRDTLLDVLEEEVERAQGRQYEGR